MVTGPEDTTHKLGEPDLKIVSTSFLSLSAEQPQPSIISLPPDETSRDSVPVDLFFADANQMPVHWEYRLPANTVRTKVHWRSSN